MEETHRESLGRVCVGESVEDEWFLIGLLLQLTCEQREQVHRVLPWALRTYYYGAARSSA